MKKIIILFVALIILLIGGKFANDYINGGGKVSFSLFKNSASVRVKNTTFSAEIAETPKEKEIGLSEKKSLPQDKAMLFQFGTPGFYSFWMKNMKFPIDIIYIKNNKVVTIYKNVQPPSNPDENPQVYTPTEQADTVLEINAGLSNKYSFSIGDSVTIKK